MTAGPPAQLRRRPRGGGDDGYAGSQGFELREAEPFVALVETRTSDARQGRRHVDDRTRPADVLESSPLAPRPIHRLDGLAGGGAATPPPRSPVALRGWHLGGPARHAVTASTPGSRSSRFWGRGFARDRSTKSAGPRPRRRPERPPRALRPAVGSVRVGVDPVPGCAHRDGSRARLQLRLDRPCAGRRAGRPRPAPSRPGPTAIRGMVVDRQHQRHALSGDQRRLFAVKEMAVDDVGRERAGNLPHGRRRGRLGRCRGCRGQPRQAPGTANGCRVVCRGRPRGT